MNLSNFCYLKKFLMLYYISLYFNCYRIVASRLEELKATYKENPQQVSVLHPFLTSLFDNPSLEWKDVVMLGMEVFLGGIDAVSIVIFLNFCINVATSLLCYI